MLNLCLLCIYLPNSTLQICFSIKFWAYLCDYFLYWIIYPIKYSQTLIQRTSLSNPFCSLCSIIHYNKCNMPSKSSKWELSFVKYIAKFTISKFVISRFECSTQLGALSNRDIFILFQHRGYNTLVLCIFAQHLHVWRLQQIYQANKIHLTKLVMIFGIMLAEGG